MGYHDFNSPGMRLDIACGTGLVVEMGFFCAYTCLFMAALPVIASARRLNDARSAKSAWVFLTLSILMYLVAIAHLILSGIRFYKGTFQGFDSGGRVLYIQNPKNWEFLGLIILVFVQTWLGDALVIYRCYIVWDNNLFLIFVPVCLLLSTFGINCYVLYWMGHPVINSVSSGLLRSVYPLAFVQNLMTTSLIILRIFLQYQTSKKAGIVDVGSKLTLTRVMRIVIESAAIYTIQLLLLNILYFRDDTFQYVIQAAIIPSIGVTFVLLALRIEASRHESATTKSDVGIRSSVMPRWLRAPDSEIDTELCEYGDPLPARGGTDMTEQGSAVKLGENVTESIDWDSEFLSSTATRPNGAASSHSSLKNGSAYASKLSV
ncbi:hypothetical protein D9619_004237 [Psilocybe cf. subviscida]|uniref:Uncharacterized protein n=1 Tax=Psilocybe cf. subviscida TaxID=2480587 RepID=A0A8H5BPG0_9AGAR|nr:hypothetical protein D9619_004237 [Psilocybe cf. subviscida]